MRRSLVVLSLFLVLMTFGLTALAQQGQTTYVVQRGDNLTRLAERFHTTIAAIVAANGIANPNLILVGQILIIPGDSTVTPSATTPASEPSLLVDPSQYFATHQPVYTPLTEDAPGGVY